MMTRVLKLDGDKGFDRFDICWMALHLGRVMLLNDAQGKQASKERRSDFMIVRAFKAASDPVERTPPCKECGKTDPKVDKLQTGDDQRVAKADAVVSLQQPELDRVMACIDRISWVTGKLEQVEDVVDWLNASEKVEA